MEDNISSYYSKYYGKSNFWSVPVRIERLTDAPLDCSTLFKTYADALTYANGGVVSCEALDGDKKKIYTQSNAYPGQYIAVVPEDGSDVSAFIIGGKGILVPLATGSDLETTLTQIRADLNLLSVETVSDISALSGEIKDIKEVSLGELSSYEVTVTEAETAEAGYLKTYVIKQGNKLDAKINIPKDFLVKSAEVKDATDDSLSAQGIFTGDKYIDFVVNAKEGTQEESHVYLKVTDLVDVYTGSEGSIVDIAVDGTTVKATVKANSISFAQLCAEVKEYIDEQDAATYSSATQYVNNVSAALSGDYVEKIGDAQDAAFAKAMEVSSAASAYTDAQIAAHDTAAKELLAQVSAAAVTSALNDAKAYTDEQITEKIGDIDFSIYAISSDVKAELCAVSADLEGKIGQTLTDAKAYADQTSANALADAKAYTDEICASISTTVDQKITDLNIDQYAISTNVKAELCAVSAETLVSAEADAAAKVAAEAEARTEAIQALSDALSGDVKTLAEDYAAVSADYKTVSADHEGRIDTLENHISSYEKISADFALSDDVTSVVATAKDEAVSSAKQYTDEQVASIGDVLHFIGVITVTSETTFDAEVAKLYTDEKLPVKGDVVLDTESGNEYVYADNYAGSAQWVVIGDENNHATKTELKAEEDARKAADAYLSGAIDNKIYYGDYGSVVSADSLSVVKISQDEYHNLVANNQVDDKAVYVVNNEGAYNMYDERIINVGAPVSANDAATKAYVDAAIPLSVSQLIWDIEEIYCGNAEA